MVALYCHFVTPACNKEAVPDDIPLLYDSVPIVKPVVPIINECSGIADSKKNPGKIWVEEDSGNPSQLHLLGSDGVVVKTIFISGSVNRDWEDICLAAGKLYIGDIGDNNAVHSECIIYRFDEPLSTVDTVKTVESIRYVYADGPRDAEAFIVDPVSKDIFIITKRDNPSRIYKLAFPYSTTAVNTAQQVSSLTYSGVVSAALSPNGKEILLKTYIGIQHFSRASGESISDALKKKFTNIHYVREPLGEAISFAIDSSGFFTLSEKGLATSVNLYFYPKK